MLLLTGGHLVDPFLQQESRCDILVDDEGRIAAMDESIHMPSARELSCRGCIITPGLIDTHAHFRDPGQTEKEDLHTGAQAAARGGYATVITMANTTPPVDRVEMVEDLVRRAREEAVEILPCATLTLGMKGEKRCDYQALHRAGAVGFTDDGLYVKNAYVLHHALWHIKGLNTPVSLHEEDPDLVFSPGINHGSAAAMAMNLGGAAQLAEASAVARDVMLASQSGTTINIQHISAARTLEALRMARRLNAPVFAEVTPHHLTMNEDDVLRYSSLAKMNPPLRTESDRRALVAALREGLIDIIATDHAPHTDEEKSRPFAQAPSGVIGLESAFAVCYTRLVREGELTLMQLLEKFTVGPARLYGLTGRETAIGNRARLSVFCLDERWDPHIHFSRSSNCPFTDWPLWGETRYTVVGSRVAYERKKA